MKTSSSSSRTAGTFARSGCAHRAPAPQPGSFFVRTGHPLASGTLGRTPRDAWSYGVASVRVPKGVRAALARLLGLEAGIELPLAIECDDVEILTKVALASDTVLAAPNAAVEREIESGSLSAAGSRGLRVALLRDGRRHLARANALSDGERSHRPAACLAAHSRSRRVGPSDQRCQPTRRRRRDDACFGTRPMINHRRAAQPQAASKGISMLDPLVLDTVFATEQRFSLAR